IFPVFRYPLSFPTRRSSDLLLLLLLWVPVVIDKVLNFNTFRIDILKQPFDDSIAPVVYYSLPFLEGAAVLLLIIPKNQKVGFIRSEEHTSELQSRENLVCRL